MNKIYNVLLSPKQRKKVNLLGGARWIRAQIDCADTSELHEPQWLNKAERDRLIAVDLRPDQAVADSFYVSVHTVRHIRFVSRLQGLPTAPKKQGRPTKGKEK